MQTLRCALLSARTALMLCGLYAASPAYAQSVHFTFTKVVDSNTAIPGGSGNFTYFSDPSLSGSNVAFTSGGGGVYARISGTLTRIADGNTVNPSGGSLGSLSSASISGNRVVFAASGSQQLYHEGIYVGSGGSLGVVVDWRTSFLGSNFRHLNLPSISGNNVLFWGQTWQFTSGLFISRNGMIQRLEDAYGGAISGDNVAFQGVSTLGLYAINTLIGGTLNSVADTSTPIPSGIGNFVDFGDPSLSGSDVAFQGTGTLGQQGIYTTLGGTLNRVADTSTPIPSGIGNFTGFGNPSLSGSDVAFQGTGTLGQQGIYTTLGGTLSKVIAVGDILDGNTVSTLGLAASLDGQQIAFYVSFTNSRKAIYIAAVSATAATVSGTLTLQSCVNSVQPMTFVFRPTDGSAPLTRTATLDATGAFSLPDLPRNSYNVWIKGAKWLAKVVPVDASMGDVTGVTATLLAGDANNDNHITTADYLLLKVSFGATASDPNWNNGAADFNCDGIVSTADYLLLKQNFGQVGDP